MSTNAFGSPDLDLRPPEMKRSTMPMWIKICPNCGYVHSDIENDGERFADYIKTADYLSCEGHSFESKLSENFYKYALILLKDSCPNEAYNAFLHAAWACDDACDFDGAVLCREKAIALGNKELFKDNPNLILRHIDLLRRAGKFSEAIALCESTEFKDKLMQKIASFQKKLSENNDTGCYRVEDCK